MAKLVLHHEQFGKGPDLVILHDVLVDDSEVLGTLALSVENLIVVERLLEHVGLGVDLMSRLHGEDHILLDKLDSEAVLVLSVRWHVLKVTWSWVVSVDAPVAGSEKKC